MAYPVLTGAVLIEATGAALNNAGLDQSTRAENAVVVKQIRIGKLKYYYPYVSGQAWRRWWREVLYQDFGWKPSEITRQARSAYTKGDPITYEEDDLFGYMAARKRARGRAAESQEAETSGTYRRISPLKNSLLISVLPNVITRDFGHFSRNLPPGADIIPFEAEHYTTFLQGVFTVSLSDVGQFQVGEMLDLSEEILSSHRDQLSQATVNGRQVYRLSKDVRIARVQDILRALEQLRGGAHLARNLSDVTPVVVLVGFLDGGNAPFQRIFEPDDNDERVNLNLPRLRSVVEDYRDRLLVDGGKGIFFGYRPTVLANEAEVLDAFRSDELLSTCVEIAGRPQEALEKAAQAVPAVFERHVP